MRRCAPLAAAIAALALAGGAAYAQSATSEANGAAPYGRPVDDEQVWVHAVLDQLEGRLGGEGALRWDGEAWAGPDELRERVRSEGELARGQVTDGQTEILVSKPVSTYFDVEAGARYDLDSRPGRGWLALGVEGLAPGFFKVAATAYAGDRGRLAAKLTVSYDQLITNRLVLQPQAEVNLYAKDDPARKIGSGVSDLDAGLRLRYEIARKFAPYVGVAWERKFGRTADLVRAAGESANAARFSLGVRAWF
jgi:copper resistance protein B